MDAQQMRETHGRGPVGERCENCAFLQPTVTTKRPGSRSLPLTTFICDRQLPQQRVAWSLNSKACGLFTRA